MNIEDKLISVIMAILCIVFLSQPVNAVFSAVFISFTQPETQFILQIIWPVLCIGWIVRTIMS